jgi:RNA polymerase sigma-70 factor, ECF subfamily
MSQTSTLIERALSLRNAAMQSTLDFGPRVLEHLLVTEAQPGLHDSDATFVRAAQQGDTEAFGQLYRRYARMVHGILLGRVRHVEVEDLVQEVFLRALPRVRELRDTSRFGSWLATIARNLAIDYYRRSQTRAERPDDASNPDEQPAKLNVSASREAAEILDCIRNLPEAYRETLILRLVEGMTGPEIAAKTGLSPGSVRVNLHRGMHQLRQKLAHGELRNASDSKNRTMV